VRTTISLDADIYEAAKALADASGQNLGVVVSALARKGFKAQESFGARSGLPVFQVPADAPVIPGGLTNKLLAEDVR
jgi:hypothetical protein